MELFFFLLKRRGIKRREWMKVHGGRIKEKSSGWRNRKGEAAAMPKPGMSRHRSSVSTCYFNRSVGRQGYGNAAKNFPIYFHSPYWRLVFNNSCLSKRAVVKHGARSLWKAYGCLHGSFGTFLEIVACSSVYKALTQMWVEPSSSSRCALVLLPQHSSTGELLVKTPPGAKSLFGSPCME